METYSYKGLHNLIDKVRRFYAFSAVEIRNLAVVILVFAFIVGFNDGRETSTLELWGWNFLVSGIIIAFSLFAAETAKRVAALIKGFKAEFKVWWYGLLLGIIVALLTNGYVWLLLPGGMIVSMLERHRLGKFRYGMNYYPIGGAGMCGPFMHLVLALFFKLLGEWVIFQNNPIITQAIAINLALALSCGLLIPPLDGAMLFFSSRIAYGFWYSLLVGGALLIWFDLSFWVILFGGLGLGTLGLIFSYRYEKYDIV